MKIQIGNQRVYLINQIKDSLEFINTNRRRFFQNLNFFLELIVFILQFLYSLKHRTHNKGKRLKTNPVFKRQFLIILLYSHNPVFTKYNSPLQTFNHIPRFPP